MINLNHVQRLNDTFEQILSKEGDCDEAGGRHGRSARLRGRLGRGGGIGARHRALRSTRVSGGSQGARPRAKSALGVD